MTLKNYLLAMAASSSACWACFIFIVFTVNPETTNWLGFFLFYLSLFLALAGTAALAGFLIRFVFLKKELAFYLVKDAFRQSFLFSSLAVAVLILLARDLFSWLNIFLLVLALSFFEYFLISYKKTYHLKNFEG